MISWSLAPVREEDIGVIARIHALSFDDAWSGNMIRRVLAMPGTVGITARSNSRWTVSGFAIPRFAADECELLSIAVEPGFRCMGIGKLLLKGVFQQVEEAGVRRFFLEVAEDNLAARRLYERQGLIPVGRRPRYYSRSDGTEIAALTLCREFPDADARGSDLARLP